MTRMLKMLAMALVAMMLIPCTMALALDDIRDDVTPTPIATPEPTQTPELQVPGADPVEAIPASLANTPKFSDLGADMGTGENAAVDIASKCKINLSEGKKGVFLDNKIKTYWSNKKAKARIEFNLPAAETAGGLYIEWSKLPSGFTIDEFDADKNKLATTAAADTYKGLVNYIPLNENTRRVRITLPKKGTRIAKISLYSKGTLPAGVQTWQAPPEKVDLLVVVAHQGEEFSYMGGTIPYYATAEGKTVQVVYMANGGRQRYKEALTGLWTVGLRNYPTFVGFKDGNAKNITQASRLWKTDTTRKKLVELIRQFKPEVIVTTDIKGENKLGTNMLLAQMMQESVVQAADDTKFADSATKSGTWQTKKLYLHLYNENQISMDYTTALDTLGGVSPSSVAREGYGAHATLLKKTKYEEGGQYDNSKFGLAFTTVGDDVMKNDMFENITESAADWDPTLSLAGNNTDDLDDLPDNLDDPFADDLEDLNIDETGLEPLTEDELNQMSNTLDGVANEPTPAPPIEQAAPGDGPNVPLISLLVGVPVVLGGGAYGYTAYRKYDKKRRRAKRRAERQQKHDM